MSTTMVTAGEHHPTAWYAAMKPREKTTFWACFGGWVLDAMDVQIFSFTIPAIIAAFAITKADAGLIGTATLLTSAFGGEEPPGARQIVVLDVESVQTSCGYSVPRYDYQEERPTLKNWALRKGEDGIREYWREKNTVSIDGLPTGMLEVLGEAAE